MNTKRANTALLCFLMLPMLAWAEIDLTIDLGSAGPAGGGMSYGLRSNTLNVDTAKAASFQYYGLSSSPVEVIAGTVGHRQVAAPCGLFDLQDIVSSGTYLYTQLQFYHATGTKVDGFYTGSDSYKTTRFAYECISGTNQLTISETDASGSKDTVYQFDGSSSWTLVTDEGQRKEIQTQAVMSGTRVATTEVRDASDSLVAKYQETYVTYGWGEQLVKRINDPDGTARTSIWIYQTGTSSNGYGRVIESKDENGYWVRYNYDSVGRPAKVVSQYLDSPDTATDAQSRVKTISYTGQNQTEVETLLGTEIGRQYTIWSGTGNSQTQRIENCVTAGASAGASDSVVTTTVFYEKGQLTTLPDGTVRRITTGTLGANGSITTTEAGLLSGTSVSAGRRNIVQQDGAGNLIQSQTYDIASGLLIGQVTAHQTDSFGRPTQIDYLNGTSSFMTYGCCGLDQETSPAGITTTYGHDVFGNVSSVSRQGITVASTYDPVGHLLRRYRIGSDSSSILIEGADYSLSGWPTAAYGQSGVSSVSITSDSNGVRTQTSTLPSGGTVISKIYPDGHMQQVAGTAALPRNYEYGVDETNGEYVKEIMIGDSGGASEWQKVFLDLLGRSWKKVYPDGATATDYWNTKGQLIREVDPDGVASLYAYNSLGEREYVAIDANSNGIMDFSGSDSISRAIISYATANGQTVRRINLSQWGESGEINMGQTDTSLTSLDRWSSSLGIMSHSALSLSGSGNYTNTSTANTGETITSTYVNGRLASLVVTGSGGIVAGSESLTYDPHGRVATETSGELSSVTYGYNNADLVTSVSQESSSLTYEYDASGNRIKATRGGLETDFTYSANNHLTSVTGALAYPVSYSYDSQGRVKTLTTTGQVGDSVTTWNYDSQRGWLTSKRNAEGKGPDYTYTAAGRVATRQWARASGGSRVQATYSYNGAGDLSGVSYNDGTPSLAYAHDRFERTTGITQGSVIFGYSLSDAGMLLRESITGGDLDGMKVDFQYDSTQRLTRISPVASSSTSAVYGYDGASRLSSVGTGGIQADYQYVSGASRISAVQFKYSGTQTGETARSYDTKGRLSRIATMVNSGTVSAHGYTYDDLDQRTQATLEDGSNWIYGYDNLGQVTSGTRITSSGTAYPGRQFSYTYDSIGNRTSTTINGQISSYTANAVNEYTQRQVPGVIDLSGEAVTGATVSVNFEPTVRLGTYFSATLAINNTSAPQYVSVNLTAVQNGAGSYEADLVTEKNGHFYVPASPEAHAYDDDGNLLSDGRYNYTWDAENRLIAVEAISAVPEDAKKKAMYAYDPLGRRVQKKTWIWNSGSSAYIPQDSLRFLYSGWNLAAEVAASGTIARSHIWGADLSGSLQAAGGVGGLLFTTSSGTAAGQWFPAYDGNGNVMALMSVANGTMQARFEYDPFGRELRESGTALASASFRFSSKYFDSETGLNYFGFRFYSPSSGRWLSRDPLEEGGGINLYSFVGNDGINECDLLGLTLRDAFVNGMVDADIGHNPVAYWGLALGYSLWDGISMGALGRRELLERGLESGAINQEQYQTGQALNGLNSLAALSVSVLGGETAVEFAAGGRTLAAQVARGAFANSLAGVSTEAVLISADYQTEIELGVCRPDNGAGINWNDVTLRLARAGAISAVFGGAGPLASRALSRIAAETTGVQARENIPGGITYEGNVSRAVNPRYIDSAWDINANNIGANHRYSSVGRGALYTSTSDEAMAAEMSHYGIDMNSRSIVSKNILVDNILDLTNPEVRTQLDISLEQITGDDYFMTHALGDFSRSRYNGILAPSARAPGTSNLILFNGL